jgi:heme-degrading monooxygenase HmoA
MSAVSEAISESALAEGGQRDLLTVEHLTMRFGGLVAIDDLSMVAKDREITAIIGPNGAGKTTVFNCLTGFYKPTVGRLTLHHPDRPFLLEQMEGFISIERFESLVKPGKILSLSIWRDEAAIEQWRNMDKHRRAQSAGRGEIFADYRLRVAHVLRDYGMKERREAPEDSAKVHGS